MTTALLILVPISLLFLGIAVWVFFWAADDGQFDDLEAPAWKIVLDDDSKPPEERGSDQQCGSDPMVANSTGVHSAVRGHRAAPTEGSEDE